jgi:hypothetical protein
VDRETVLLKLCSLQAKESLQDKGWSIAVWINMLWERVKNMEDKQVYICGCPNQGNRADSFWQGRIWKCFFTVKVMKTQKNILV